MYGEAFFQSSCTARQDSPRQGKWMIELWRRPAPRRRPGPKLNRTASFRNS
jgi:hypothetical protein